MSDQGGRSSKTKELRVSNLSKLAMPSIFWPLKFFLRISRLTSLTNRVAWRPRTSSWPGPRGRRSFLVKLTIAGLTAGPPEDAFYIRDLIAMHLYTGKRRLLRQSLSHERHIGWLERKGGLVGSLLTSEVEESLLPPRKQYTASWLARHKSRTCDGTTPMTSTKVTRTVAAPSP